MADEFLFSSLRRPGNNSSASVGHVSSVGGPKAWLRVDCIQM